MARAASRLPARSKPPGQRSPRWGSPPAPKSDYPRCLESYGRSFPSCRYSFSRTTRRSHGARTRTSCGRIFPDFVRGWRRSFTDADVGWDADDGLRLRPVSEEELKVHLSVAVHDLEPVDFRLVEARGPPPAFRDESRFGNQGQRGEAPNAAVAGGDRHAVPGRDLLRGEALLVERNENPERVIVEERLPVRVVQQEVFGEESGTGCRRTSVGRSHRCHAADSRSLSKSPRLPLSPLSE